MIKIRVMVVDDSVVIRKILSDTLSSDPDIEVVGVAQNGRIALSKIPQVNPDLITLDIEMPEMNGLETLEELRKDYPKLPVIMFSTLTQRGAEATLDALSLGASDYVTKPANVGNVNEALARVADELIPKVKRLTGKPETPRTSTPRQTTTAEPRQPRAAANSRIDVVAIGVSTGGPVALAEVMPAFPANFPVPVVITQHMPPVFTKSLADRLDSKASIAIAEGSVGDVIKPGSAWIAPGDHHMTFARNATDVEIRLNQNPPENSCRPAVDVMFRSVVEIFGANVLGVILTGMGQDGLRGCEQIFDAGGSCIAQDESTCVVWGMPSFISGAGLAAAELPLTQIGPDIVRRVQQSRQMANVN